MTRYRTAAFILALILLLIAPTMCHVAADSSDVGFVQGEYDAQLAATQEAAMSQGITIAVTHPLSLAPTVTTGDTRQWSCEFVMAPCNLP